MTHEPEAHGTLRSYIVGFTLSILLTLIAFWVAGAYPEFAVAVIIGLALVQLFVQLVFFLHLGQSKSQSSDRVMLGFTILIILIVIGGTLWIMTNLQRLHPHVPTTPGELYEGGVVSPEHELH